MSERKKGSTSVSLLFRLTDSTTGAAKSGIDVMTLKLQYERPGEAASTATSLTLLSAATATFTAYGAIEIDATNSKGIYRVDAPDAGFATGADEVTFTITGTGIEPSTRLIDLTSFDSRDGVRGGLTAIPSAAVGSGANSFNFDAAGNIKGSLSAILGTALTETAGYLAAAFKQFFNVAEPTSTMNEVTLVDTVATNSDMRGTDNAALAATALSTANWTSARAALLDHLDADVSSRMATFTLPTRFSSLSIDTSGQVTFNNTTIGTATNLTNAPTAGDFTAAMKASLNAATPSVTVSDKTGFQLAADQHVIVDSGTVTTLSNLPAIPANWLTSAGIAAGALDGKGDWLMSSSYTAPDNTGIAANGAAIAALGTPAKAGDAMTLTAAYDAAKTAAAPGAKMDLVDAPNAEAITAIQSGMAMASALSAVSMNVSSCLALAKADEYIDTGVTPWARVLIVQGSGGIGVGTELLRQKLYDPNGVGVTSSSTVIGEAHQ